MVAMVYLGCYNKATIVGVAKTTTFLSQSSGGKFKIRCWQIGCLIHNCLFSLWPHVVERERQLSRASFIWARIPGMRTYPPWPNSLQRLCLQTPSHWGLVFNIRMWEDTNMQSIIVVNMCHYNKLLKTILGTVPGVGIFWIGSFFSDHLPQHPFFR